MRAVLRDPGVQGALLAMGVFAFPAGMAGEAAAVAGEEATAISTIRQTAAGETFFHYGYAEHAAGFAEGLRPGGLRDQLGRSVRRRGSKRTCSAWRATGA